MTPSTASGQVYLTQYLAPLAEILARTDVTDIHVHRPGEVWVETLRGATERHEADALTERVLQGLAQQVAAHSHQGINREHPLLSANLPNGARVQIVAPPATRAGLAMSIRKHVSSDLSLTDYVQAGAFLETTIGVADDGQSSLASVRALLDRGDIASALRLAVQSRLNILVSGGTSTGKTTFLSALIREIPDDERLILIEDTPELRLDRRNAVALLAPRSALGEASVTADDLVAASLRMRPDRILIGELRGREALAFLRAINTGHPGSMSTVHADSPASAVEQIALLVLQAGTRLSRDDVKDYVASTVDVFVQLGRRAGRRFVQEVACKPAEGMVQRPVAMEPR